MGDGGERIVGMVFLFMFSCNGSLFCFVLSLNIGQTQQTWVFFPSHPSPPGYLNYRLVVKEKVTLYQVLCYLLTVSGLWHCIFHLARCPAEVVTVTRRDPRAGKRQASGPQSSAVDAVNVFCFNCICFKPYTTPVILLLNSWLFLNTFRNQKVLFIFPV